MCVCVCVCRSCYDKVSRLILFGIIEGFLFAKFRTINYEKCVYEILRSLPLFYFKLKT